MVERWIHLILSQSYTGYPFEHVFCGNDVCQKRISQSAIDKIRDIKNGSFFFNIFIHNTYTIADAGALDPLDSLTELYWLPF